MEIVNKERFEELLKTNKLLLVDFYADWCGPCKMVAPVLEKFKEEANEKIEVVKINVDNEESLVWQFGIQSIPTLLFFKDGKPFRQEIGYRTLQQLHQILEEAISE
ncbi:MAG: thioredoxin [Bacilli bacterium]|nr:thioredoxin [Bacilli bacterium]